MKLRSEALLLIAAAACGTLAADEGALTLDPANAHVDFTLEATGHNVTGSFVLHSGDIRFDRETGAASGEIRVDLIGAETGNKKRDKTMHDKVLETPSWPLAVFRPHRIDGALAPGGVSQVQIEGTMTFHGADHEMTIPASVTIAGSRATVDAEFPIPFVDWGLHDPSFLFLRVAKTVQVHVVAEGTIAEPQRAAAEIGGAR